MEPTERLSAVMKEARKGTTTVGLVCKDGVVVAADKQASAGYIENRYEIKVYAINDRVAITTAGMVGDLQYLTRVLRAEAALSDVRSEKMSAKSVTTLLCNILQANRWYPYMVMLLVAGYDDEGPSLYSVDPVGGMTKGENVFTTGSGGPLALGVLDADYVAEMDTDAGVKLALKALKSARIRDLYTGGMGFNVMVLTKKGIRELRPEEIEKLLK